VTGELPAEFAVEATRALGLVGYRLEVWRSASDDVEWMGRSIYRVGPFEREHPPTALPEGHAEHVFASYEVVDP